MNLIVIIKIIQIQIFGDAFMAIKNYFVKTKGKHCQCSVKLSEYTKVFANVLKVVNHNIIIVLWL